MMTKDQKIAEAVLRLTAKHGWDGVRVTSVARSARVPVASLKKRFATPSDFLPLLVGEATRVSLKDAPDAAESAHDALFVVLMARFDFLAVHRKAVLSIAHAARHDKALFRAWTTSTFKAMRDTLCATEEEAPVHCVLGLMGIYSWAFWAWRNDDTPDLSKTMAALDRALRWRVAFSPAQ